MQSARSQRALLFVFIFVMCIFFALSYRQEQQARDIKERTYVMCVARNANVLRTNAYYHGMIHIERHNPYRATSPETIHQRIALFRAALLKPVDCGALK